MFLVPSKMRKPVLTRALTRHSILGTALLLGCGVGVEAHPIAGLSSGFKSGFLHPLSGLDHVLAMVAVGIWGVQLGKSATWVLPVTFPLVMAIGGAMGVRGVPLSHVETGIAASALVLGILVALAARLPLWIAMAITGVFAVFHGYAHGVELPHAAQPLAFGVGFVAATGLLHLCGISLGLARRWTAGSALLRFSGAAIAAVGVCLLTGVVTV
jgi:urease accessory protein